jgi:hypothetical protein
MGAGPVRRSFSKGGCNFTEMLWDSKIEFRNYWKLIQNKNFRIKSFEINS